MAVSFISIKFANIKSTNIRGMKSILSLIFILVCSAMHVRANDGVYYTSGNFLVPVSETDISVAKEILTITIGKDSMATVDVYYEFENPKKPKTVTMAFEATPPYNAWGQPMYRNGGHPNIENFTVTMNGKQLDYKNALVATQFDENGYKVDFTPLDMSQWKTYGEVPDSILFEPDALYNKALDSLISFAYAYFFEAPFKKGKNIVHHTYSYKMSYNVEEKFNIPYWLTPATRWANGQVDDFTLRIKSEQHTEFCIADSLFQQAEFTSSKGKRIHHLKLENLDKMLFAQIDHDETIEWHTTNFCPKSNMNITSAIWEEWGYNYRDGATSAKVVECADGEILRYTGETEDSYFVNAQDWGFVPKKGCRVVEYKAENGQGCLIPDVPGGGIINVREQPSTDSGIIGKIKSKIFEIPEVYDCKGLVENDDHTKWFKLEINGKTGYVRSDLMQWDAINTY